MAKKNLKRGFFVTFEGPEGCGKSTHAKLLCEHLTTCGYSVVHTHEPGGTPVGEKIRHLLLHSPDVAISDLAELFLFEASRSQIVREVIVPALRAKKIVVCDRFSDATMSYQGYGGTVPRPLIRTLNRIATGGLEPDLTVLLDIDTKLGLARAREKGLDRMELKDVAYHRRVRAGYLALARRLPRRIRVIRVDGAIEYTQRCVRIEVERALQRYQRT